MVNYGSILSRPQNEINRQFYEMLTRAEAGDASAIQALADKIGDDTTANTILKRLKDVEASIGTDDTTAGSLKKRCKDIETSIGIDDTTDGSLKKRCKAIETAIGSEDTSGTILYRIKALEDG